MEGSSTTGRWTRCKSPAVVKDSVHHSQSLQMPEACDWLTQNADGSMRPFLQISALLVSCLLTAAERTCAAGQYAIVSCLQHCLLVFAVR
jgi:hypothetical protein